MSAFNTQDRVAVVEIGAVDASATPKHNIFVAPARCRITAVKLVCGSGVALDGSNYGSQTVTNVTQTETVATLTQETGESDAGAIVADTVAEFTLSSTASELELVENDVLQIQFEESGSATSGDLVEASVSVEWRPGTGEGE